MSNGASIAPLSSSAGGAPVLLDDTSVPGKVIHANPADSGAIARVVDVLVGNPNSQQITLGVATVGPGAPAPSDFESMVRIDVPPTAEGTVVRIFYTPFVLSPGYSYYISSKLNPGDTPPYLYGYVENFPPQYYGGVLDFPYAIRNTVDPPATTPLPNGELRLNNIDVTLATKCWIDDTDALGINNRDWWAEMAQGDWLNISAAGLSGTFVRYEVQAVSQPTGYTELDISHKQSAGTIPRPPTGNSSVVLVRAIYRGAGAAIASLGGMVTTTTQVIGNIASPNWVTIPFQDATPQGGTPQGVTVDLPNNRLSLDSEGTWAISVYATITFSKTGGTDREIFFRLWNETKGIEATSGPTPLYVEQGNTGASWALPSVPVIVDSSIVGDWLRLELGGSSSAFNSVEVDKAGINLFKVG